LTGERRRRVEKILKESEKMIEEDQECLVRYRVWLGPSGYWRDSRPNFGLYKTREVAEQQTDHWKDRREIHRFVLKREELE